jgi:hypothetical protein
LGAQAITKCEVFCIRSGVVVDGPVFLEPMSVHCRCGVGTSLDVLVTVVAFVLALFFGAAADLDNVLLCIRHVDVTMAGLASAYYGSSFVDAGAARIFGAIDLCRGLLSGCTVHECLETAGARGCGRLGKLRLFRGRRTVAARS